MFTVKQEGKRYKPGTLFIKCEACPGVSVGDRNATIMRFELDPQRDVVYAETQPPKFPPQKTTLDMFFKNAGRKKREREPEGTVQATWVLESSGAVEPQPKRAPIVVNQLQAELSKDRTDLKWCTDRISHLESKCSHYEGIIGSLGDFHIETSTCDCCNWLFFRWHTHKCECESVTICGGCDSGPINGTMHTQEKCYAVAT